MSFSKVLTVDEIKKCSKVAFIPGTFDPITNGHIGMGTSILDARKSDCIVYIPTRNTPHKTPSNFSLRYKLTEKALKSYDKLFVPPIDLEHFSAKSLAKWVREIKPDIKVISTLGSDYADKKSMYYITQNQFRPDSYIFLTRVEGEEMVVDQAFHSKNVEVVINSVLGASATKVRNWFQENLNQYFVYSLIKNEKELFKEVEFPDDLMPRELSEYILSNGVYLDSFESTSPSIRQIILINIRRLLNKFNSLAKLMNNSSHNIFQKKLKSFVFDGHSYELSSSIASNRYGRFYRINYEGKKQILFIANSRDVSKEKVLSGSLVRSWLYDSKLNEFLPNVTLTEENGEWMLFEEMKGVSLSKILIQEYLHESYNRKLHDFYTMFKELSERSGIKVNLHADNVIFVDGKFKLRNFFTLRGSEEIEENYNDFYLRKVAEVNTPLDQFKFNCKQLLYNFYY